MLQVHQRDMKTLLIIAFADASFANAECYRPQLRFSIFLSDDTKSVNWLHYSSKNCKGVVRSVLSGETHAFGDPFYASFAMLHYLSKMTNQRITLNLIMDLESLFKVVVQSSTTPEKVLVIDIKACRKAYNKGSTYTFGRVRSRSNVVDGLTKMNVTDLI